MIVHYINYSGVPFFNFKENKMPARWTEVYPQGTREGDEEQRFFIAIARNPEHTWRSIAALAKETGLTTLRIEQIIAKYHKKNMVFENSAGNWGYWERNPSKLQDSQGSIADEDHKKRIAKP